LIDECEREMVITAAPDSLLLHSDELPPTIFEGDTELIADAELRAIADRVRSIADPPWRFEVPRLQWGLRGPGLVRYNRVEGLSLGARALFDMGPATLHTEARFGVADLEPRGEVALDREGGALRSRLAAYRRLQPVTPSSAHGT